MSYMYMSSTANVAKFLSFITPDFKALTIVNGKTRPASGSMDISGEGMTFRY